MDSSESSRYAACFKEYNKKEHLVIHMIASHHSVHEPVCPVCNKHFASLDSVKEHITGLLSEEKCSKIFRTRGCTVCLNLFDTTNALRNHQASCLFSRVKPKLLFRTSSLSILDTCGRNHSRPLVISLACKMVSGGHGGMLDLCARVCLIDEDENIILHTCVKPRLPVTNYRYAKTGIQPEYLKDAIPSRLLQRELQRYLCNGVTMQRVFLVGHGLDRDLPSLGVAYPAHMMRDTARYPPLLRSCRASNTLKYLTRAYLGYDIQTGVEDPYEDCVATMRLYKRMRSLDHLHTSDIGKSNSFAAWRQKELEKMTPLALLEMSRSNYYCWCLDSTNGQNNNLIKRNALFS